MAPVPGVREVNHREEERRGETPHRNPAAAALNFDGEGAELREGGEVEHLGWPGDPGAAVGLHLEAGAPASSQQQQGGQLGLPGVSDQGGHIIDVGGGGDPRRASHPKDDGVI